MNRTESFEATRPDGEVVVVERDLDTGAQTVTVKGEPIVVHRRTKAAPAVTK